MAEPTSTATAAAATVAIPLLASLPWLGDLGIVLVSALAAAFVQLGGRDKTTPLQGAVMVLRIMFVSVALSGALVALLQSQVELKLAPQYLLAIMSFVLGLADGNWRAIGAALGNWLLGLLPARKGGGA
jgi:hypothetical protein